MSAPHDPGQDTNRAFVNTYRNARTESQQTERPEIKDFLDATDGVLAQAAEMARVVASAPLGAVTQMIGGDWSQARKHFSLSEKYASWADYHTPAMGVGFHAYIAQINQPMRLTQAKVEAHPTWKNFGVEYGRRPPMHGWLAVRLIGPDG